MIKAEWTVADHKKAIAEIVDHENKCCTYDAKRVDKSIADMQYHAKRIRYLQSSPEQQRMMDWEDAIINAQPSAKLVR